MQQPPCSNHFAVYMGKGGLDLIHSLYSLALLELELDLDADSEEEDRGPRLTQRRSSNSDLGGFADTADRDRDSALRDARTTDWGIAEAGNSPGGRASIVSNTPSINISVEGEGGKSDYLNVETEAQVCASLGPYRYRAV